MDIGPYGQAALFYYAAGWRGILPVPLGAKQPVPTGYTGAEGRDPSRADIEAWLEVHGGWNVALRVPEIVIGIDVDAYGGKAGAETLERREAQWGRLPDTWRTSSRDHPNGIYLFRLHADEVHLAWPASAGPGIDLVRYGHRYVMAWPSLHPEGRQYLWRRGLEAMPPGQVPRIDDLPFLPPGWVQGLTRGELEVVRPSELLTGDEIRQWQASHDGTGALCPRMRHTLERQLETKYVRGAARHDWMTGAVFAVVTLAAEGHGGVREALRSVSARFEALVADDRNRDQWEWARAVDGAVRKAAAMPDADADPCIAEVAALPQSWQPPMAHQPVPDPTTRADLSQHPAPAVPVDGAAPTPEPPPPAPFVNWADLYAGQHAGQSWHVEGVIPDGPRVTMIWSSKSGDGKTLLAWEIAYGLATGTEVWGRKVGEPLRVLVIDYENSAGGDLLPRLRAMGHTDPAALERIALVEHASAVLDPLDSPEGGLGVLMLVRAHRAHVVIIDTTPRAVAGGENDADTWHAFDRCTVAPLKREGVSVIRLDQAGKDVARGPRGSRGKVDGIDLEWRLAMPNRTTRTLTLGKARMIPPESVITLSVQLEPLSHTAAGSTPMAARVADLLELLEVHADEVPVSTGVPTVRKWLEANGYVGDTAFTKQVVELAIAARKKPVWNGPKSSPEGGGEVLKFPFPGERRGGIGSNGDETQ